MISQSALKRGLIDPQIQKARRAKMQLMASKAYAAKVSSKQMPYVHSMYRAYHNLFWTSQDEKFINELKSSNDSLDISKISSKKSSVVSQSLGQDIAMLNIDDKNNGPDQSNISKEMKKKKVDFGEEQNFQSEMRLMNKKKQEEIKSAIQSKNRQEKMELQMKIKKQEETRRLQKQKQIRLAKQKQEKERERLKLKQQQQLKQKKQKQQREAALQAQKILQKNREQLRLKKQAQTRQINEKIQLQKKKIRQIQQLQKLKQLQQQKILPADLMKQQQQQQQEYQQVQEQCGPSYYEMMSNLSNPSKIKNDQIDGNNIPTVHSSMIIKSEPRQEINFLSSLRQQKNKKEIEVPSSWREENVNAKSSKDINQNKGNLVQSNQSNKSQDYRKTVNNLYKSEANFQKKSQQIELQNNIKIDSVPVVVVVDQPIIQKEQIQEKEIVPNQPQVQNVNISHSMIELGEATTYLNEKKEEIDQLNQQKDSSAILAQLNSQSQRIQESSSKIVANAQILESFQQKPKLQSSYSLQQFRIDSHTIDHFSRPSLKIVQQQKQTKDRIQQIIVEQDINPSVLISQAAQEQNMISQIYDQSKTINADDTVQEINVEEKIDAIVYDLLLNIDQKNGLCPQCSSNKLKNQELIKKIEDLQQKNRQLIHQQQELMKKARQNIINFETKILNLENQKQSLMQKLQIQPFYMVNPGIKGQKRKNSQGCLPQKNMESKKDYNSEQSSAKNSSDEQESGKNSSDQQQNQKQAKHSKSSKLQKQLKASKNQRSKSQSQNSD